MKIALFVISSVFIFGIYAAFAEESVDLLVSPVIGETLDSNDYRQMFIVRDIENSPIWHLAYPEIAGLDYVEGDTYLISAKKSFTLPLVEFSKYELIEIKKVFQSHKPYNNICVPGYHVWIDGDCEFACRCSEHAYPGKLCVTNSKAQEYLRPLQQERVGISSKNVICLESLQLIIAPNGNSACVKSLSIDKLLERSFRLAESNNDSPYD